MEFKFPWKEIKKMRHPQQKIYFDEETGNFLRESWNLDTGNMLEHTVIRPGDKDYLGFLASVVFQGQ